MSALTDQLQNQAVCIDRCIPDGEKLAVLIGVFYQLYLNGTGSGGGGGSGYQQVTNGAVDPVNPPSNPAVTNLYVNNVSGVIWLWPAGGSAWQ